MGSGPRLRRSPQQWQKMCDAGSHFAEDNLSSSSGFTGSQAYMRLCLRILLVTMPGSMTAQKR